MKLSRNKKLIITNAVLLVLLAAGFTYAWFASTYGNMVDADQVQVVADSELQISFNGTDWSSYLNLNSPGSPVNLNTLRFTDITGSGDSVKVAPTDSSGIADGDFLKPALNQLDGYAEVASGSGSSVPIGNTDYIKFNLFLRSTDPLVVKLGTGSAVTPQSQTLLNLSSGDKANNISSLGNFSRDLVAGAVRVSMVKNAGSASPSRLFTWIPCPNIYLDAGPSEPISNYTIYENAGNDTPASGIEYTKIVTSGNQGPDSDPRGTRVHPYQHWYFASSDDTIMTQLTKNVVTGTITNETQQDILTLGGNKTDQGYYINNVTVYIWLEGCDNEARRAFVDGRFNVSLVISAQDPPAPTP